MNMNYFEFSSWKVDMFYIRFMGEALEFLGMLTWFLSAMRFITMLWGFLKRQFIGSNWRKYFIIRRNWYSEKNWADICKFFRTSTKILRESSYQLTLRTTLSIIQDYCIILKYLKAVLKLLWSVMVRWFLRFLKLFGDFSTFPTRWIGKNEPLQRTLEGSVRKYLRNTLHKHSSIFRKPSRIVSDRAFLTVLYSNTKS